MTFSPRWVTREVYRRSYLHHPGCVNVLTPFHAIVPAFPFLALSSTLYAPGPGAVELRDLEGNRSVGENRVPGEEVPLQFALGS